MMQHTIKTPVVIEGTGLHSGCRVRLVIKPSPVNSGIVFKRVDLPEAPELKALYSNVVDTRNCTCLGDGQGNLVSTIEHLMAALRVCGIDNAVVETDNQEIPIMDGSAKPFYDVLAASERGEQSAPRRVLKVLKKVSFSDDKGNTAELSPADDDDLHLHFCIEFPSPVVGRQEFDGILSPALFAEEIAPCRTFCEKYQVDYLRSIGLIKGGSLDNAVVLDGDKILNKEGFRRPHECVNHKVLDAIGDLYTAGVVICGQYRGDKTGHWHNNELLKRLFADSANYQIK